MNSPPVLDGRLEPNERDLDQLAEIATEVREARARSEVQPVIVEFAGSPKSGKSTTIDVLTHFFKRMKFKVRAPTEGASKRTPYHLRRDLVAFNSYTLNYAISELLDAYYNIDQPDLVILDRGPFDSLAWLKLLRNKGELEAEAFEKMRAFALLPLWTNLISRIYLFSCDPDVSLDRENSAKLTRRSGTAMNTEMLTTLRDQYDQLGEELDSYPVVTIDTSETTDARGTSFRIATDLLELLRGDG